MLERSLLHSSNHPTTRQSSSQIFPTPDISDIKHRFCRPRGTTRSPLQVTQAKMSVMTAVELYPWRSHHSQLYAERELGRVRARSRAGVWAKEKGRMKRPFCWYHPCHVCVVKAAVLGLRGRAPRPKESATSCGCSGFGRLRLSGWAVRSVTGLSRSCSEPDRARC